MAIDTAAKRLSACKASLKVPCALLPDPDNAVNVADRPTLCWIYRGLTYSALAAAIGDGLAWYWRRRGHRR
jgi:hypothetical protein